MSRPNWTQLDTEALLASLPLKTLPTKNRGVSFTNYFFHRGPEQHAISKKHLYKAMVGDDFSGYRQFHERHAGHSGNYSGPPGHWERALQVKLDLAEFFGRELREVPFFIHEWPEFSKWRLQVGK
jgi:hypothetical protein